MGQFEEVFFWIAVYLYALAFLLQLASLIFKKPSWAPIGWYTALGAFGFHTATIAARWIATGHPPVVQRYENNLAGTWFVMLMIIVVSQWFKKVKIFALFVIPVILIMLGQAFTAQPELKPLAPNFQSWWLWIHVTFAWFAYSSFAVAGGLGIVYLLKSRVKNVDVKPWNYFPEIDLLDDIILRFVLFGFVAQTMMLISGSIWANNLWGSYWSWDPLETWSLVTWLTYGIILHFRLTMGWKGKRIAWLVLGAILTEIITFYGIGIIVTVHAPLLQ